MVLYRAYLMRDVLPSPERACPDTEGGGVGLGGKSDIMPCNLFLRFSEPRQEERDTKHPVMQRGAGRTERPTDGQMRQKDFNLWIHNKRSHSF